MSTFTDWNGPQGGGARAMDLIQLANAYSELVTKLNQHISDRTPGTSDVHGIRTYVEAQIAIIRGLIPSVSAFITEVAADNKYALKSQIPSDTVNHTELANYVQTNALNAALASYLKTNDLSSNAVITAIQSDIDALELAINADSFTRPILKATEYVEGLIHAVEQIQFTWKKFGATVGGSNARGVFYLLGMLDERAGTAYLRFTDTHSFAAIIDFTITTDLDAQAKVIDYKDGQLSVVTDADKADLTNVHFLIVKGTSAGKQHVYLAIQADEWMKQWEESGIINAGLFSAIPFEGAGINFIPVDSEGYRAPTGATEVLFDLDYFALTDRMSAMEAKIDSIVSSLKAEITRSTTEDQNLQDQIDGLRTDLDKEVEDREASDTALNDKIGNLNDLETDNKSNTVTAINELLHKIPEIDEVPTKGSDNVAKSGGTWDAIRFASVKVGETMYWHLQDDSSPEDREVHSDNPFVFNFKGQEISVETHDGHVQLCALKDVPDGWHALDGKAELLAADYPDLAAFMPENVTTDRKIWLPYVQHKIIKVKY